jgi:hypothetical protein
LAINNKINVSKADISIKRGSIAKAKYFSEGSIVHMIRVGRSFHQYNGRWPLTYCILVSGQKQVDGRPKPGNDGHCF